MKTPRAARVLIWGRGARVFETNAALLDPHVNIPIRVEHVLGGDDTFDALLLNHYKTI